MFQKDFAKQLESGFVSQSCHFFLCIFFCAGNLEPHWLKQVGVDLPLKSRRTDVSYEIGGK